MSDIGSLGRHVSDTEGAISDSDRHLHHRVLRVQQWPTKERPAGQPLDALPRESARPCPTLVQQRLGSPVRTTRPMHATPIGALRVGSTPSNTSRISCSEHATVMAFTAQSGGTFRCLLSFQWCLQDMPCSPPVVPRLEQDARPPRAHPATPPAPKARAVTPADAAQRACSQEAPQTAALLKLARPRAQPSTEPDRNSKVPVSELQISEFQVSELLSWEFLSFGIPQVRHSNFSTHEFDCSGGSRVGRHYK